MIKSLGVAIAALALLSLPSPQPAQAAGRQRAIPFDPPLTGTFTYRVAHKRAVTDFSTMALAGNQQIGFARDGAGYVLKLVFLDGPLLFPDPDGTLAAPWRGTPVEIRLAANGAPLGIRNWPAVQRALEETGTLIGSRRPPPDARGGADRREAEAVATALSQLTEREALDELAGAYLPALGWGGRVLAVGKPVASKSTMTLPVMRLPLPTRISTTLGAYVPGSHAGIIRETVIDDRAKGADPVVHDMRFRESVSIELRLPSGVAQSVVRTRKSAGGDVRGNERLEMTLVTTSP